MSLKNTYTFTYISQFTQYSFEEELWLSEERLVGSRKGIGRPQSPCCTPKTCAERGSLREDHLPPPKKLGKSDLLRSWPQQRLRVLWRRGREAGRSCHSGHPPAPQQTSTAMGGITAMGQWGASLDQLPTTSSRLLCSGLWPWLTLCQVKLPPSHPTRYSSQCWGPREEPIPKRTLPHRCWAGYAARGKPQA